VAENPKIVYKVVARMPDGKLLSAVDHECPVEYRPGQEVVSSYGGPLFAFESLAAAESFVRHSMSVDWRQGRSALEIWRAEARGVPERQKLYTLCLDDVCPRSVADFWNGWRGEYFQATDEYPCTLNTKYGTVFCESLTLAEKVR